MTELYRSSSLMLLRTACRREKHTEGVSGSSGRITAPPEHPITPSVSGNGSVCV